MKNVWVVIGLCLLSVSANATLISRAGGLAYYDTATNLTWVADANLAKTSGYDAEVFPGRCVSRFQSDWATKLILGEFRPIRTEQKRAVVESKACHTGVGERNETQPEPQWRAVPQRMMGESP